MKKGFFIVGVFFMSMSLFSCSKENNNKELYDEVYDGKTIVNEPIVLTDDGTNVCSSLLYEPTKIIRITDYTGQKIYDASEYRVEGKKVYRTENSSMPYIEEGLLINDSATLQSLVQNEKYAPYNLSTHPAKENGKSIVFTEGVGILMQQVQVTYEHKGTWNGYQQKCYEDTTFSRFINKLKNGDDVTIVFYGASTMSGCNTSGKMGVPPYMDTFPELIVKGLQRKYPKANITSYNPSIGGMLTDWAVNNVVACVNQYNPDFVFTMWGMNDASWQVNETTFDDRCRTVIQSIQANTEADILFGSSMFANLLSPQNTGYIEKYLPYIQAYEEEFGIGIVDFTSFTKDLYPMKKSVELLNNNINHPNDFFARIMADLILRAIIKR